MGFLSVIWNTFVLFTLICMLMPPTIGITIFYPISKKVCVKISDYIVHRCAPRLFKILGTYKKFKTTFYSETKSMLPEQFIIISNHQSLLDIPLYMAFMPEKDLRFVAKDALGRHVPMVSAMLKSHEHCLVPRKGGTTVAMRTIDSFARRCLERKQIPVIFPEGTRSKDGNLLKFYSAGFRRITDTAKLPVAVCVIDDGYKMNTMATIMENLDKVNYRVKVLKVYPAPETKEEQMKILDEAHVLMQEQLDKWHQEDKE